MAIDLTELQTVDFALGAVIAHAFDNLAKSGPENYQKFIDRPLNEKIFRAENDDIDSFVRKISNAQKGDGTKQGKPGVMPVVAYKRRLGISNGDSQARIVNKNFYDDETGEWINFSLLPVSLDYSLAFCAWDTPTLDKMQLAWYAFVAGGRKNVSFPVPVEIEGQIISGTTATILDPKTVMFSDATPDKSQTGRIVAVNTEITVNTQIMVGEHIEIPDQIRVEGFCSAYIRSGGKVGE